MIELVLARVAALAVIAVGALAFSSYAGDYYVNRGFGPPPKVPVAYQGKTIGLTVRSPSLGFRPEKVLVHLPAAYRQFPTRRFPTLYLLHGTPGSPKLAFVRALHVFAWVDKLTRERKLHPMIVVAPPGSNDIYQSATEWADGPQPDQHWFTYLVHDVVALIDGRLRTIRDPRARGIAGYSSGADAALNTALLAPGVFDVVEGWSGTYRQDYKTVSYVQPLVFHFSAVLSAQRLARVAAAHHVKVFMYVGSDDHQVGANRQLADELRAAGVPVTLDVVKGGGHGWTLWAARLQQSLRFFDANALAGPPRSAQRAAAGGGGRRLRLHGP